MLQPTRLVEGNVGQQINGRFKDIEGSVCAVFVKTVFYLAALYIDAEYLAVAVGTAQMCVFGLTVFIQP